jgi:hypothetical protein
LKDMPASRQWYTEGLALTGSQQKHTGVFRAGTQGSYYKL